MNIVLWVLQVLIAAHAAMGAVWKFKHSEQTVPDLSAIPHGVWRALSAIELLCVAGLILPVLGHSLGLLAPISAVIFALEMLLFCGVHFASGATRHGHLVYWLVVGALCAFIAYGRFLLAPI